MNVIKYFAFSAVAAYMIWGARSAVSAEPILISINPAPNGCHYYCPPPLPRPD